MKARIVIVGLIWLVPLACWLGVPRADRAFATFAGSVFASLMTVFFACQRMLRCGACGAATPYFANYTQTTAKWRGNRRRYFACRSCGNVIDRVTGMPVAHVPDTPVVRAPSRSDVGCGVAGLGGLMVFGSLVVGALVLFGISSGVAQPGRAEVALKWCIVTAVVGVASLFAGWFISLQ